MNLYLLTQTVNENWDTYDSAVVCAASEKEARMTHPGYELSQDWDGETSAFSSWCAAKDVKVKLIGVAADGLKKGVVCASFNAG